MNILFLSYWNINDPLTSSTVFPHLKILSTFSWVNEIVFVNIEREVNETKTIPVTLDKITYRPYHSVSSNIVLLEKFHDFIQAPAFIARLIKEYKIDALIARGAPAGGLAWLVWRKTKVPFYVESFEPHAAYMIEAGVWKKWDPRTIIELILERKQKKRASGLMPVAYTYSRLLEKSGIDKKKIKTVPCIVDDKSFVFSAESRRKIRKQLNIPEKSIVGIYAGRYGGLYMEQGVFQIYKLAFVFFAADFHLILLSPAVYHNWIIQQIQVNSLPADRIHFKSVSHHEVPSYLSAGDFAFATYKPGKAMAFLSPVKIGEYWANGLPVLLTEGVGDETEIINKNHVSGMLFQLPVREEKFTHIFSRLRELMSEDRILGIRPALARKARNQEKVVQAYEYFLNKNR
jgi:hypothetical protein